MPSQGAEQSVDLLLHIPNHTLPYTISVDESAAGEFPNGVFLEDVASGAVFNLLKEPYLFYSEAGLQDDRFRLHFNPVGVPSLPEPGELNAWVHDGRLFVHQNEPGNVEVLVTDLVGRLLLHKTITDVAFQTNLRLPSGVSLVRVSTQTQTVTLKVIVLE